MELAFRLLTAAVVVVAPSLLFLGLWHGLHALRDDHLIARMHDYSKGSSRRRWATPMDVFTPADPTASTHQPPHIVCYVCGTPNPMGVTFCHECLSRLGRA